jgi:hypothetical protein
MDNAQGESIRFWQTAPLCGVELLSARYIDQRFAPHVHEGFVIGMIMAGAQRYRYRGAEHLAGSGTLVLINPDELHTGHKGTEDGWLYRAFYPDSGQVLALLDELELPTRHLPAFGATLYRDQDLVNGFCQLHHLLESPSTALQQQTAWREMMLSLLQRHAGVADAGKPGKEHRAVSLAKDLLQARLAAPPSLEELAGAVNLSPVHFARVFRQAAHLAEATTHRTGAGTVAERMFAAGSGHATGICRPESSEPAVQAGVWCGAGGVSHGPANAEIRLTTTPPISPCRSEHARERAPLGVRPPALSLTTIASMLAPTGDGACLFPRGHAPRRIIDPLAPRPGIQRTQRITRQAQGEQVVARRHARPAIRHQIRR